MITNSGMTIYNQLSNGSFKRTYIPKTFWRNIRMEEIKKYGADNASSVSVMVFYDQLADYVKAEDFVGTGWTADTLNDTYIVKGECPLTDIEDVTMLRDCYKACAAVENLYGGTELWHVRIEGK